MKKKNNKYSQKSLAIPSVLINISSDWWLINCKLLFPDLRWLNNSLNLKVDRLSVSCSLKVTFYKGTAIDSLSNQ